LLLLHQSRYHRSRAGGAQTPGLLSNAVSQRKGGGKPGMRGVGNRRTAVSGPAAIYRHAADMQKQQRQRRQRAGVGDMEIYWKYLMMQFKRQFKSLFKSQFNC